MSDRGIKVRLLAGAMVLAVAMTGLGARLAFLHLGDHKELRERAEVRRTLAQEILAGRGSIHDRNGGKNILALNLSVKDVCVDPSVIVRSNAVVTTVSRLAESFDVPTDELFLRLNRPRRRFAYVKRFVPEGELDESLRDEVPGIFFRDVTIRYYPHRAFMCHLLGFVNHEGIGSSGIELALDRHLRGRPGFVESRLNALRQELPSKRVRYEAAHQGGDVGLTVDQNVQYALEKALDSAAAEHSAKGAWGIVQRIRTGEILAMASRPCFDLNEFPRAGDDQKLNRAIGYVYEPGSTFKAVTIAAALNEGCVTPETVIYCENGAWSYKGRILRDYHSYGNLTVADVVKKSSNIGTAKIAVMLGERKLERYLKMFGIGRAAGMDLPGEENGILHPRSEWSGISITRIPIGQGVAVTALQMLSAYSAIANDGFLMRPYVIANLTYRNGRRVTKGEPEVVSRPISAGTAATMRRLLARVTEKGGTGWRAQVSGYSVAGKTGTAQKPIPGGYSSTQHVASFVGFLPAGDPEVAVIVVVDEPQPIHTGGRVAAPAFAQIADHVVRYLGIRPTHDKIAMKE